MTQPTDTITDDDRRHLVTIAASELGAHKVPPRDRVRLGKLGLVEICGVSDGSGRATMRLTERGNDEMTALIDRELVEGDVLELGASLALQEIKRGQ